MHWGKGASPPPLAQHRERATQGSTYRPTVVESCHTSVRPAFQSALLCTAYLRSCRQPEKRAHNGDGLATTSAATARELLRTSDAPHKARLHAPGISGNHVFRPKDLQKGSQASGWPAVASVQAAPRVRSRTASLTADRSIPTHGYVNQFGRKQLVT